MPPLHIDGVALLADFHATEQRRTKQSSSCEYERGCWSYLLLQERVDYHKIPVWEIKNWLSFASGWNAILRNMLLLSLMRESDTDASHQKQENESRGGRRDEGASSLSEAANSDWWWDESKSKNCLFYSNIGSKFGMFLDWILAAIQFLSSASWFGKKVGLQSPQCLRTHHKGQQGGASPSTVRMSFIIKSLV